jgi:hypothetical protein
MVAPAVTASIEATLEHLARELERVDREIEQLFDDYPPLRRQRELLISIPVSQSTAAHSGRDAEHRGIPRRQSNCRIRRVIASSLSVRLYRTSQPDREER